MRYDIPLARPAGTAIAAVLALSPIGAMAQTVATGAQQPEPVPMSAPPAETAPAQPVTGAPVEPPPVNSGLPQVNSGAPQTVFAPQSPMVQPVPSAAPPVSPSTAPVPQETPSSASATSVTKAPAPGAVKTKTPVAAPKDATAPTARSPRDMTVAKPASANAAATTDARPSAVVTTPVLPAPAVADEEAALEEAVAETGDDGVAWALGIGALAFLAGVGAITYGGRSTSRRDTVADDGSPTVTRDRELAATPGTDDRVQEAQREYMGEDELAVRKIVAESASTGWHGPAADLDARREAMIAEALSAANPFLTRRNRLRRADFLLRREEASRVDQVRQENPAPALTAEPARPTQPAPEQRRMRLTYRLPGETRPATVLSPKFT